MHSRMSSCPGNCAFPKTGYLRKITCIGLFFAPALGVHAQDIAVTAKGELQSASQTAAQASLSPLDHSVYTPTASAPLGRADTAAVTELTAAHSALTGSGSWTGFQATGTITYADDPVQYNLTLSNVGAADFRLDVQMPTGVESVRIHGRAGKIQSPKGTITPIDPDTAIMGIFPFEIVAKASSPGKNITLVERGEASTNGHPLHRVTLELSSIVRDPATKTEKALPMDLYFDPSTHLLAQSVNNILIPGARLVPFLSVVTYSDYRSVGTSMIPFHYVETLNGQLYRTVQLTSVQTNQPVPPSNFQFERSNQ